MTEKGQPLPYPLDACAGCRDLTEQLATAIAERDALQRANNPFCLLCGRTEPCMTDADVKLGDPGLPCTFDYTPLKMLEVARQYKQQLARSTHAYQLLAEAHEQQGQQLAQMTQERDKWNEYHRVMCRVEHELRQQLVQAQAARTICDVHQAEFDRLEEQLAQVEQERNESYMTIATLRGHLDVLCQAIEAREHDEDYLRCRAADARQTLAQGRGA